MKCQNCREELTNPPICDYCHYGALPSKMTDQTTPESGLIGLSAEAPMGPGPLRWTNMPNEAGTWFRYYRSSFQTYEYVVIGPRGPEYARIPGCLLDTHEGMRWLGPIPPDPDAQEDWPKRDVK